MNNRKNSDIPAIIISTGKTVDICDFINMVLEFEEKPKDKNKQTPPKKRAAFVSRNNIKNQNK